MILAGDMNIMLTERTIRQLHTKSDLIDCVQLLRKSFGTVAREFGPTEATAPTNPAFATESKLNEYLSKPVMLYGMFYGSAIVGAVAVEQSKSDKQVYIERLAVSPESRHKGFGDYLLCYAFERIRESGGKTASIALMDNNDKLKKWYIAKGFVQTGRKAIEHLPFEVCFMSKDLFARSWRHDPKSSQTTSQAREGTKTQRNRCNSLKGRLD